MFRLYLFNCDIRIYWDLLYVRLYHLIQINIKIIIAYSSVIKFYNKFIIFFIKVRN